MIKLIVGTKGSGKTKAMIDQINDAVKTMHNLRSPQLVPLPH